MKAEADVTCPFTRNEGPKSPLAHQFHDKGLCNYASTGTMPAKNPGIVYTAHHFLIILQDHLWHRRNC